MNRIENESSRSSSATHRMTQASTTLNRRYVRRPASIAVEEAAREANYRKTNDVVPAAPSRLVNLRVRAADLEAARAEERAAEEAAREAEELARAEAMRNEIAVYPTVVELGSITPEPAESYAETSTLNETPSSSNVSPTEAPMNLSMPTMAQAEVTPTMSTMPPAEEQVYPQATAYPSSYQSSDQSIMSTQPYQAPNDYAAQDYSNSTYYPAYDNNNYNYPIEPIPQTSPTEVDTSALAMSIAADYAAASLGASIKEYGDGYDQYAMSTPSNEVTTPPVNNSLSDITANSSVDSIARAASDAIASIRVATEPSEVTEQVASLKAFADSIKSNHSAPEVRELGDTIEKFVNIAMKSTKFQEANTKQNTAKVTLSPKATRAAAKVAKSSAKVMAVNNKAKAKAIRATAKQPLKTASPSITRTTLRTNTIASRTKRSPQELKNRAIEQALHSVATMDEEMRNKPASRRPSAMRTKRKGSGKRFALAFTCAILCVAGVIAFVSANIPDITVRVAAMQTGIEAAYPSYVPRDYSLGDIFSENGKITMIFNGPDGATFTLSEEKSSWDGSALLRNYVEPTWEDNYTTSHEQGITVYISNVTSDAAWVNSGVLYKITSSGTQLTKKQVRSIVVSL